MKISYKGNGHEVSGEDMTLSEYLVFADNLDKFTVFKNDPHLQQIEAYNAYLNNQVRIVEQHPEASNLLLAPRRNQLALPPAQVPYSPPQEVQPDFAMQPQPQIQPQPQPQPHRPPEIPQYQQEPYSFPTFDQPPVYSSSPASSTSTTESRPLEDSRLALYAPTVLDSYKAEVTLAQSDITVVQKNSVKETPIKRVWTKLTNSIDKVLDSNHYVYGGLIGLCIFAIVAGVLNSNKSPIHLNKIIPSASSPAQKPPTAKEKTPAKEKPPAVKETPNPVVPPEPPPPPGT